MEKLKKLINKNAFTNKSPSFVSFVNIANRLVTLPHEVHLLIVESLPELRDVFALSFTCRSLHDKNVEFAKIWFKAHYPDDSALLLKGKDAKNKEQIRRLYTLSKLKELEKELGYQGGIVNKTARALCQMQDLRHNIRLQSNWQTLYTAVFLGDVGTCLYLLEKEKIDIQLGCYAILAVMNIEFLAPSRNRLTFPRKINNENLIYKLLFEWSQGKKMFQAAKKTGLRSVTLSADTSIALVNSFSLNASIGKENGEQEALSAEQELLIVFISGGYFKVVQKLIESWKIKPKIPAMVRIFIQASRNLPDSQWLTLFKKHKRALSLRERQYLVQYYKALDEQKKHYSFIQERGYKALIPELESLLDLPANYVVTYTDQTALIQANIEAGRIECLQYLLEKHDITFLWDNQTLLAWKYLYTANSERAVKMVANWLGATILSDTEKDEILTGLLEHGYLKAVIQAYSLDKTHEVALSLYSKKIKTLVQSLSSISIESLIKQALQGGYIDLLTDLGSSVDKIKTIQAHWLLQEALKVDRLDTIQWFIQKVPLNTHEGRAPIWRNTLVNAIQTDNLGLFKASIYYLGIYERSDLEKLARLALENTAIEILVHLVSLKDGIDQKAFCIKLLDGCLKAHSESAQEEYEITSYVECLPVLEAITKAYEGRFSLDVSKKLYRVIKAGNPDPLISWMRLLLIIANRMNRDHLENTSQASLTPCSHEALKQVGVTQGAILALIERKNRELLITTTEVWTLLAEWLNNQYPYFALSDDNKLFIQELLKAYLFSQELVYIHDPSYRASEKTIDALVELVEKLPIDDRKSQHVLTALVVKLKRYDLLQILIDIGVTTAVELHNNHTGVYIGYTLIGKSARTTLNAAAKVETLRFGQRLIIY